MRFYFRKLFPEVIGSIHINTSQQKLRLVLLLNNFKWLGGFLFNEFFYLDNCLSVLVLSVYVTFLLAYHVAFQSLGIRSGLVELVQYLEVLSFPVFGSHSDCCRLRLVNGLRHLLRSLLAIVPAFLRVEVAPGGS
jgi:hypothetical protein